MFYIYIAYVTDANCQKLRERKTYYIAYTCYWCQMSEIKWQTDIYNLSHWCQLSVPGPFREWIQKTTTDIPIMWGMIHSLQPNTHKVLEFNKTPCVAVIKCQHFRWWLHEALPALTTDPVTSLAVATAATAECLWSPGLWMPIYSPAPFFGRQHFSFNVRYHVLSYCHIQSYRINK